MLQGDAPIDDRLLAYHMGWLSRTEMNALEAQIEASAELAGRSRAVRDALGPLEDWTALPAVDGLEDQVLRRVRRQGGRPVATPAVRLRAAAGSGSPVGALLSFKEVLAVAACIAALLTLVVPGFARSSALAQRRLCADNLRQVGTALGAYVDSHAGALPFAGAEGGNWLREPTAGVLRWRNSRHRFLLLAQGYLDAKAYVCPADAAGVVMRFEDHQLFDDFAEPRNCSYDSQIMPDHGQVAVADPALVVYADSNPLFDRTLPGRDGAVLNSRVHQGLDGQNVLRLAGGGRWESSPNVGVQNDNIWQIGRRVNYTGRERPQFATDSFLIP